jgi:hypothetical protein
VRTRSTGGTGHKLTALDGPGAALLSGWGVISAGDSTGHGEHGKEQDSEDGSETSEHCY